jgi:PTH2 family peptidyl-tRNA hydrolase
MTGRSSVNDVKQVIIIRKDLKVRRGKEIAQGAHASIAWLTSRLEKDGSWGGDGVQVEAFLSEAEWQWVQGNFRKITCVVNSEEELLSLVRKAKEAGLTAELIQDSGLTEFGGVPTYTAAAIGPDYDEKLDPVTGDLVLY